MKTTKTDKKVSVVIPTYCGSKYLCRCVDSVLNQTYKQIEVLVVDDNGLGSEEQLKTAAVMKQYEGDDRVKYICHEVNINGSAARNTGVKHSSGDFIALMDDDDEFYPHKIERQIQLINTLPEIVGVVYCACEVFYGNKKVSETHALKSGFILYECLMHQLQIPSTSMLIRKTAYQTIGGFDESFYRHQDWEFVDRIAARFCIKSDDFIGFKRNLEFRNRIGSPELFKERRLHYLEKMMPLIKTLSPRQQKNVLVRNRMDIFLEFIKNRKYKEAYMEYHNAHPGIRGLYYFALRILKIINRGRLRLVKSTK